MFCGFGVEKVKGRLSAGESDRGACLIGASEGPPTRSWPVAEAWLGVGDCDGLEEDSESALSGTVLNADTASLKPRLDWANRSRRESLPGFGAC